MGYHALLESSIAIAESKKEIDRIANSRTDAEIRHQKAKADDIYDIREAAELRRNYAQRYKDEARTKAFTTALEAVYITSLQENAYLTEADYRLSEALVSEYIKETGIDNIMFKIGDKTPFLANIKSIVEDAVKDATEDAEDDDTVMLKINDNIVKDDVVNKMEEDPESNAAVQIISKKISAAEEEFIKKNAEDKQKIADIVSNINDRIAATKEDDSISDDEKKEIEQECNIEMKQKIADVYDSKTHNLFDHITRGITESIIKDDQLKTYYFDESGKLDMDKVIGSARCMYGFCECVNTIRLENTDLQYMENLISNF